MMDQEKELLLTNSKEWLVNEMIAERRRHHERMVANINFTNQILRRLNELTAFAKGFYDYGALDR